jgi:UDP-glucose 4-epimerase
MAGTVLMTGATSFTGCHIARALHDSGFEVVGLRAQPADAEISPLVRQRIQYSLVTEWVDGAPFGSAPFLAALRERRPAVFVNHGASIVGYRSPDFDFLASAGVGLRGVRETAETLVKVGCGRVLHSGSIFEPDEGEAGVRPMPAAEAMSPYGLAKGFVWQGLRYFMRRAGLPLTKIVIANPVGPLENEDRLIPVFLRTWKAGGTPTLRAPALVRDNIPAPWLAGVYAEEAKLPRPPGAGGGIRIRRPSGYVMSNEEFLKLFTRNFEGLTERRLGFEIDPQPTAEPERRVNPEPCLELVRTIEERVFWKDWARFSGL